MTKPVIKMLIHSCQSEGNWRYLIYQYIKSCSWFRNLISKTLILIWGTTEYDRGIKQNGITCSWSALWTDTYLHRGLTLNIVHNNNWVIKKNNFKNGSSVYQHKVLTYIIHPWKSCYFLFYFSGTYNFIEIPDEINRNIHWRQYENLK